MRSPNAWRSWQTATARSAPTVSRLAHAARCARNDIHRLENLCEEQHDAVQEWRDARFQDMSPELQVRITDLVEHIQRVLNHVRRVEARSNRRCSCISPR